MAVLWPDSHRIGLETILERGELRWRDHITQSSGTMPGPRSMHLRFCWPIL